MRYRKLDVTGDYVFGHQQLDFFIDSPEAVAQAVKTRLLLLKGEWFTDITDGTDYAGSVLGKSNQLSRDREFRSRILDTPNVVSILSYTSAIASRALSVFAIIDTQFGQTTVSLTL